MNRRDFMRSATAIGVAGLSAPEFLTAQSSNAPAQLDIAEWSYFWVGVERAELARANIVNGQQMYVEYLVPAQVRHAYPIVLVHGGGGQGLDWMGTPDGRRGWSTILLEQGYKVYIVDRPGHGRSPYHPETHGAFSAQGFTLESISGRFTPPNAAAPDNGAYRKLHNQWPGTGEVGSPDLAQLVASQGGSYAPPAAQPPGGQRGAAPGPAPAPPVLGPAGMPAGGPDSQHLVWRQRGAMLLDKIGPAIIMTHSAGGPFGWLVAEVRPNLVKGIVVIEGGGTPFTGQNVWGLSSVPVEYEPRVSSPSEIKTVRVESPEPGAQPYLLQAEPARKLKNLRGIPIVIVTAEASFASPGNPGAVAYLKQAGCTAEELRLVSKGVKGNGHMMMVEKNNREVLQPILEWIDKNVPTRGARVAQPAPKPAGESTAMKLADQGYFWVGLEHVRKSYGTILKGQMYVQYLIPAQVRHPYPVILVHGGGGQMLHYMGIGDGVAGWAHYYVQEGYRVYLVDRPGHGRAPYHPEALGPMGPVVMYSQIAIDTRRSAVGPNKKWPGTGDIGDPILDTIMAAANAAPTDAAMAQQLWASRGAELLDKIGPAIIQTHSAGGPFGWIVANERPKLVKAIVSVEGGGTPFANDPENERERKLRNLNGIPIVYITGESSGRAQAGPNTVNALKAAGNTAEDLQLKDRGILGNGHFMMMETNRKQVFDVISGWLDQKVKA